MDDPATFALDKSWVRRSFDRASRTYDAAAVLQAELRDALLQRLDLTRLTPVRIVDAGAGTGHASRALKRRYPRAQVIAVDCAFGMLSAAAAQQSWLRPFARLCADAERLPLPDGSTDLIVSNCMLHWGDPDAAFAEFRRVLTPRGLLTFTTFGPDTLRELRAAWRTVEGGAAPDTRVSRFVDMHDLGDGLLRAGFSAPVLDVERYTLTYTDVPHLAADLRAVGARNATASRPRGLTTPRKYAALQAAYEEFRSDGRLPATYEVVFGQAWAPATGTRRVDESGNARVPLDDLKRQLRTRRGTG